MLCFSGQVECRTVRVVDAEEGTIKVHPQPLPDLELDVAACLRDEVQTKKFTSENEVSQLRRNRAD